MDFFLKRKSKASPTSTEVQYQTRLYNYDDRDVQMPEEVRLQTRGHRQTGTQLKQTIHT